MKHLFDLVRNPNEGEKLFRQAAGPLCTLAEAAEEDNAEAAEYLFRLAAFATDMLTKSCNSKTDLFSQIAAKQMTWPVLASLHSGVVKRNEEFLLNLKLASATGLNVSRDAKKAFSLEAISTQTALQHYKFAQVLRRAPIREWTVDDWIEAYTICNSPDFSAARLRELEQWGQSGPGKSLPPLSKATAPEWQREFRRFLEIVHGERLEECPELAALKASVYSSAKDNEKRVGGAGVIRERIRKVIIQAIAGLAAEGETNRPRRPKGR